MEMEAKVVLAVLILKLGDTLNEESIANNKQMKLYLKRVKESFEKLQNLSDVFDKSHVSREYLCVIYEVEDEIEKFRFRVARQEKRFGFLMNQTFLLYNLNSSCCMLIRNLNNLITKINSFPENHNPAAATPRCNNSSSITCSSTAIWPISTIPSPKRGTLTRSFTTISQKKKLTCTHSYTNGNTLLLNVQDHHCSNEEVVAKGYNDLHVDLKPCLLYLALFPKDYNIPVRRLLRLWLAEGFVERNLSPEDIVQKHFEDLVNRGMIQITKFRSDNSPKQCRLVPVFHDYLLAKAQDTGLFSIHHKSEHLAAPFGVRRMIQQMGTATETLTDSVWAHEFNPSLLRSYVSFNRTCKDMPAPEVSILLGRIISSSFRLLRVLDLEGVNKPTLPNKLDHLCLLKYLGLRRTHLDDLPESVGKLYYLETLDLKHTNIYSLPNSIWKLKHLRHLNLNNVRLTMPPSSSSTLVTLWGLYLDDKISANELEGLLNLRELGIKFHLSTTSQHVLLDWTQKLADLQSLRLISVNGSSQPSKLVYKTLATLTKLSHLYLYGNLCRLPACLIVLRLLGESFTGKRMVSLRGGFKQLEVLKLWKLAGLEEWDVEGESMEGLKELDIRYCHKLKKLPCRVLIKPRRLERLKLAKMPDDFVERITKRISTDTTLTVD